METHYFNRQYHEQSCQGGNIDATEVSLSNMPVEIGAKAGNIERANGDSEPAKIATKWDTETIMDRMAAST